MQDTPQDSHSFRVIERTPGRFEWEYHAADGEVLGTSLAHGSVEAALASILAVRAAVAGSAVVDMDGRPVALDAAHAAS